MSDILDKAGLLAVIAPLTGLDPSDVFWADDPHPSVSDSDRAQIKLTVFTMYALGVDEHRRHLSDGNDGYALNTFWVEELGNRHVVINVRAEVFDKNVEASELIDRIRTGVRAGAVTAQLDALRLAYVWSEKTVRVPNTADTRALNTATADFTFAGIARQVSEVDASGGWIQTVNGNNQIPGDFT
jgi:hypothetical protein